MSGFWNLKHKSGMLFSRPSSQTFVQAFLFFLFAKYKTLKQLWSTHQLQLESTRHLDIYMSWLYIDTTPHPAVRQALEPGLSHSPLTWPEFMRILTGEFFVLGSVVSLEWPGEGTQTWLGAGWWRWLCLQHSYSPPLSHRHLRWSATQRKSF